MKKKKDADIFKDVNLNEVTVKATRIQMVSKGDTLIYDASAFAMADGSLLRDLINNLPGAEIRDGDQIYVQGKKVDKLTLNGKNFFQGRTNVLLDNLPYYTVKNINVYDKEKSQQEKLWTHSNKKDYVMDVNLKKKFVQSNIFNGEVGLGSHDRKLARLFSMFLSPKTNVALFGNANNINEESKPKKNGSWSPDKVAQGTKDTNRWAPI